MTTANQLRDADARHRIRCGLGIFVTIDQSEQTDSLQMTNATPYHAKEFDVAVVLGGTQAAVPWRWQAWKELEPMLTPFVTSDRGRTSVRSSQTSRTGKHQSVSFGRMGRTSESHARWTHGSPANAPESNQWMFLGTEVWAPTWTVCEREREAPDFYAHLLPAPRSQNKLAPRFGSILVVALASTASTSCRQKLHDSMIAAAALLKSPLAVRQLRPWGIASGSTGGFRDAVQDFGVGRGLFKRNDPFAIVT